MREVGGRSLREKTDSIIIEKGIQRIRRLKHVTGMLFFGFIPVCILSSFLEDYLTINSLLIIAPYFLFVVIWNINLGLTAICPRCNELYYWQMEGIGFSNFFTERCLNCGLDLE
jgi:hypothetical protein